MCIRDRPVCTECGRIIFYDPKVAVICVVPRHGKVLMIRRGTDQGYGLWGLPGGYVDRGEIVEQAAIREVWEETGLKVELGKLIGLFSESGNPVIVAVFAASEIGGKLEPGPEALDVGFFPVHDLPSLAFPRDQEVLTKWESMESNGR